MEADLRIKKGNELSIVSAFAEAKLEYLAAIEIESDNVLAWGNLGVIQEKLGENERAIESLKKALYLAPDYALAHYNLGMLLVKINNLKEGVGYLERAAELKADNVDFVFNSGVAMQRLNRVAEEIFAFEKVQKLKPNYPGIYYRLWLAYRQVALWRKMELIEPKLIDEIENDPFISLVRSEDSEQNLIVAKRVAGKMEQTPTFQSYHKRGQKIRLGYFTSDLREHPVGQMISEMLPLHDLEKFEVVALSTGKNDKGEIRAKIKSGVDKWVDLTETMDDYEMAQQIYAQKIDVLIEMTGFTRDSRLGACAFRPAPVQVEWLGYPGTTGADFMDYVIVDRIVVPESEQRFYSEKLLYLPHCYQVNSEQKISRKKYSRRDWGLPETGFIFGSFNQQYKIEPVIWKVWMNILQRVPGSVLWLWSQQEECSDNLQREAEKHGIDPVRIIFSRMAPKPIHLARLAHTDLALDTLIYGGHTTTTDYLWSGVPVVTKLGTHFASRVASSILHEVDLDDLITNSLQEYEDLAVLMANDRRKLEQIKGKLTHEKLRKTLFNTKRFVKNLEKIFENIAR